MDFQKHIDELAGRLTRCIALVVFAYVVTSRASEAYGFLGTTLGKIAEVVGVITAWTFAVLQYLAFMARLGVAFADWFPSSPARGTSTRKIIMKGAEVVILVAVIITLAPIATILKEAAK